MTNPEIAEAFYAYLDDTNSLNMSGDLIIREIRKHGIIEELLHQLGNANEVVVKTAIEFRFARESNTHASIEAIAERLCEAVDAHLAEYD